MQCIKCGKKLTKDEKVCPSCGKKHPDNQEPVTTKNKSIFYSLSAIFLGISLTFLVLVIFYSIALLILGILVKNTLLEVILLIIKLLIIFVVPPFSLSVIFKALG